jgi:hypothetical protein
MSVVMQKTPWYCFPWASFTAESYGLLQPRSYCALKVFTFLTSYFVTEYSLTVSPTAEKLPPPKCIPINI